MEKQFPSKSDKARSAKEILQKYDNTEFSETQYKGCDLKNIVDDFTGQRIKNGDYRKCHFNGNSFKYVGASGTRFYACELNDCIISGANMQFCDFTHSIVQSFNDTPSVIDSTNLNQSCFYETTLKNIKIENTSISQSQFFKTQIMNCQFTHATLQDNIFRNAFIENSTFIGCNMEFSTFHNTKLQNVILPFHQIAYIYGGLQCLTLPKNYVKISSSMQNAPILNAQEYLNLLPILSKYYEEEGEFFPLINIALFKMNKNLAIEYIYNGLKEYIRQRDFRKLKALCRLAVKQGEFERSFLSDLYFKIVQYFMSVELSPGEQYQFNLHIDEIKNILFDNTEKSHIVLALKTNLTIENSSEFMELISVLEDCMQYNKIPDNEYSFEIKHNSPSYSIWIMAAAMDPNQLIMFMGMLHEIITGNADLLLKAMAVTADIVTLGSFVKQLMGSARNLPKKISEKNIENETISYAFSQHKMLQQKKIKVELSIGNFHFNYDSHKKYQ